MRTRVTLTFSAGDRALSSVRELLVASGQAERAKRGALDLYSVTLWDDDPDLTRLRAPLRKRRIDSFESRTLVFTEDELIAAPLLRLIVRRSPKGYGGSTSYGNEYDFSRGCPRCGTGARRTSHLLLRRSDLPKRGDVVETGAGEVLVSSTLAQLFEAERLTGLALDDVCDQRTAERASVGAPAQRTTCLPPPRAREASGSSPVPPAIATAITTAPVGRSRSRTRAAP